MGEAVEDRDVRRFSRSLNRTASVESVIRMYGDPGHTAEVLRRYKESVLSRDTVPGTVIYDVDPVVFDDLIEIRTGGDKAVEALIARDEAPAMVSFWPLVVMSDNDVLSGWEDVLRRAADQPHAVVVEVGSLLEQALTFDFGYVAFRRDSSRLRQMTSVLYVEELRERARLQEEARGRGRPRRMATMDDINRVVREQLVDRYPQGLGTITNATMTITPPSTTRVPGWRNEPSQFVLQPETEYRIPDRLTQERLDQLMQAPAGRLRREEWTPIESVEVDVDDDPEAEDWAPWRTIYADDGNRVQVNREGLDRAGYNPLADCYVTTGECNCDDCREIRMDERAAEEPEDDDDWSEEYEEDEG